MFHTVNATQARHNSKFFNNINGSTLLLISLIAIVPSHTALSIALGITLVAVAGLGYTTVVHITLALSI